MLDAYKLRSWASRGAMLFSYSIYNLGCNYFNVSQEMVVKWDEEHIDKKIRAHNRCKSNYFMWSMA